MIIIADQVTKQYSGQAVIEKFSYHFESNKTYAIFGHNGVGKSTLLQLISGCISPNKGSITYNLNNKAIAAEDIATYISLSAPYMDLIEDMSLKEIVTFHFSFKASLLKDPFEKIQDLLGYQPDKLIKHYSSGMKQRLKLLLALFTNSDLLLLDEPTANLDTEGIEWYRQLIQEYHLRRTVIIASAQHHDHDFCDHKISLI